MDFPENNKKITAIKNEQEAEVYQQYAAQGERAVRECSLLHHLPTLYLRLIIPSVGRQQARGECQQNWKRKDNWDNTASKKKGGDTCGKGEVGESFSRREALTGFYKWRSPPI